METKKLGYQLYLRFASIWGHKFTSSHVNDEFINIWVQDWGQALETVSHAAIKDALDTCRLTMEWPPSIAEFLKLCNGALGIPSPSECMQLAIRRDFSHPIVKALFDKIGSWDIGHDKEATLLKKFERLHGEELCKMRKDSLKVIENRKSVHELN